MATPPEPADSRGEHQPPAQRGHGIDTSAEDLEISHDLGDVGAPINVGDEMLVVEAMTSLKQKTFRSMLWVALDRWVNLAASFVVFAILGRLLEPSALGVAALAATFVTLFTLLANQGFSNAIVQRTELGRDHMDSAFCISMGSALALLAAIEVLAAPIADGLHTPSLANVLRIAALSLPVDALSAVPAALLERDFKFNRLTQRHVLSNLVGGAAAVTVAVAGGGVWSVVVQSLTTSVVGSAVLWSVTAWRPRLSVSRKASGELRTVGLGVLGVQLFGFANSQSDKLLIGAFISPAAVGYYYVGSRIISILVDIQTTVIQSVSLTTFAKVQHDRLAFRRVFYKFASLSAAASVFSFAALTILAPIVIPIAFGPHWHRSILVAQILCGLGALNSILVFDRSALIGAGKARLALLITATQSMVGVVAVLATVAWGPVGVAIGVTMRQYIVWPFRLRQLNRALDLELKVYLAKWFGPAAGGVASAGAMWCVLHAFTLPRGTVAQLGVCVVVTLAGMIVYVGCGRVLFPSALDEVGGLVQAWRRKRSRG